MELLGMTTPNNNANLIIGDSRIALMDQWGIDVEILSVNPFWYSLDVDDARRVIDYQNRGLAEVCSRYPDRLVAMTSVALQHPELAAEQLAALAMVVGLTALEDMADVRRDALFDVLLDTGSAYCFHVRSSDAVGLKNGMMKQLLIYQDGDTGAASAVPLRRRLPRVSTRDWPNVPHVACCVDSLLALASAL